MTAAEKTTPKETLTKEIVFSEKDIALRVKEVGKQITNDFIDKQADGIVVVSVLKGAAIFMTDLIRAINLNFEIDFMSLSSYQNSTQTSGCVNIEKDISINLAGKHVIIAEDVIDSGVTMDFIIKHLSNKGAATVTICTFLHKHITQRDLGVKYVCFDCPKDYIVGYGLDYMQLYRNVPYVFSLKKEFYS